MPTAVEVVVTLQRERATKNTIRFEESSPDGREPALRTLYLSKREDERLGSPELLHVTLAPA